MQAMELWSHLWPFGPPFRGYYSYKHATSFVRVCVSRSIIPAADTFAGAREREREKDIHYHMIVT